MVMSAKLGKLKMPMKKKPDMAEMDMEEGMDMEEEAGEETPFEAAEEEGAAEGPEEEAPPAEGMAELDMISDEDLLAELEKRGLMMGMDENMGDEDKAAPRSSFRE